MKKTTAQQLCQKFNIATFNDGETVKDCVLCLSSITAHLTMLSEEVKGGEIVAKML
jgi:hypothetical protein